MAEPIVTAGLHLDRIADRGTRDVLRQACIAAMRGPVPIVNKAGTQIGAIITPGAAETLMFNAGTIVRHAEHGPDVTCRPAGNGLCEPLDGEAAEPSPGPGVGC